MKLGIYNVICCKFLHKIIFIIMLLFIIFFSNFCFAEELSIFDSDGSAIAYIDISNDSTIYLWSGDPVAYLDDDSIYGFNGKHLGWFQDGILYDHDGNIVGFLKDKMMRPTLPEPLKGLKELKPLKSLKELEPLRPLFGIQIESGLKYFLLNGKE